MTILQAFYYTSVASNLIDPNGTIYYISNTNLTCFDTHCFFVAANIPDWWIFICKQLFLAVIFELYIFCKTLRTRSDMNWITNHCVVEYYTFIFGNWAGPRTHYIDESSHQQNSGCIYVCVCVVRRTGSTHH